MGHADARARRHAADSVQRKILRRRERVPSRGVTAGYREDVAEESFVVRDGVAWIGRATIERVDSLRCERERVERAGWERRRRARKRGERVAGSAEAEGD